MPRIGLKLRPILGNNYTLLFLGYLAAEPLAAPFTRMVTVTDSLLA